MSSHHELGRQPKETKSFWQVKGGITARLEKCLSIIAGLLQVDRETDRIEGLFEIYTPVFLGVRWRRCDRRVLEKGANVRIIPTASRNGSTSGAHRLRFIHLVKLSPTFKTAHNSTPPLV
jgi:hypothetical protein